MPKAGRFYNVAGNPFTRDCLITFFARNRYAPVRFVIGVVLFACTAALVFFSPENPGGKLEFQGYTNIVTRTRTGAFVTNQFATFTVENISQRALTYSGTPLPVYHVEHLQSGAWRVLGELIRADDLATLLPGERIDFKVYLPETTNKWRVAVNCIQPSPIPYPFKRFFSPTVYAISSGELLPLKEVDVRWASFTNSVLHAGEHLTK